MRAADEATSGPTGVGRHGVGRTGVGRTGVELAAPVGRRVVMAAQGS
jgi:hypothetical protein